jgi:hypothetical protein
VQFADELVLAYGLVKQMNIGVGASELSGSCNREWVIDDAIAGACGNSGVCVELASEHSTAYEKQFIAERRV